MNKQDQVIKVLTLDKEHETLLPLIEESFTSENIEYQLRSNYDTAYDGIFIAQKGLATLYVFEKDYNRAQQILQDILSSKTG